MAETTPQASTGVVRNVLRGMFEGLVVITLIGAAWLGVDKLLQPDTLPIKHVEIRGEFKRLEPRMLERHIATYTASGFFSVNLQVIERVLETLPWVDTASVRRQWPDRLLVRVREQRPAARWGEEGLVNARGEVFSPPRGEWPDGLPVLFGPQGRERALIRHYHQTNKLLGPLRLQARALVQDERRAWHLLLSNGIPVALGRGDPEISVSRLGRIYAGVLANVETQLAGIDFRYTNGFSVAWKAGAHPAAHTGMSTGTSIGQ